MKTKKLMFGLLATMLMLFLSCNSDSSQIESVENLNYNSIITNRLPPGGPCPEGMIAVLSYEFDSFHFHRPVKDCESGFWFCTKGGEWVITCVTNPKAKIHSSLTNNSTTVAAIIDRENELISFHFPIGLINIAGNTQSDFQVFNVDEELTFGDVTLIRGNYNSTFTNDEIIIDVPVR
jgi:hypothetical protein